MGETALQVQGVSKAFGAVQAVDDVSLSLKSARIYALLGENGAGKSTLVSIISGFTPPDTGEILLFGESLPLGRPDLVSQLGIEMVHQHFMLVPELSVAENFALGALNGRQGPIRTEQLAKGAQGVCESLGWEIDLNTPVRRLSVSSQQRVEIAKALAKNPKVLILDEPTAVLNESEVAELFRILRQLRERGVTIVLIAHKLKETLQIADHFFVLRKGQLMLSAERGEVDAKRLAEAMTGRESLFEAYGAGPILENAPEAVVDRICVETDRGFAIIRDLSFTLRAGEVLGIGGVDGNGQVELAEALAGVRSLKAGRITFPKGSVTYIPPDRRAEGLALEMDVGENLSIEGYQNPLFRSGPILNVPALRNRAESLVDQFSIKTSSLKQPVGMLSGGNQQKVVVARALAENPVAVVACQPTRGLDFGSAHYVRSKLREAANEGAMVVLFSSDWDELKEISDRILIISKGQLLEGADPGEFLGVGG
jgi:simple sugar transport system ATP-binding protein